MVVALGDTTSRQRPAPIGVSTGHPAITAGTIGARVKDAAGNVYALSNNHVYANQNEASFGDNVLQPGAFDGGTNPADAIGTLYAFEPIDFTFAGENYVDAAIALSSASDLANSTLPDGYGTPSAIIFGDEDEDGFFDDTKDLLQLPVQKYGRTTGLTDGVVSAINVYVEVCYEQFWGFCIKSAYFFDQIQISGSGFSGGGDSGSLIVTNDANKNPVGLLFAGSDTTTFANRIDLVLNAFGVTIDDGTGTTPTFQPHRPASPLLHSMPPKSTWPGPIIPLTKLGSRSSDVPDPAAQTSSRSPRSVQTSKAIRTRAFLLQRPTHTVSVPTMLAATRTTRTLPLLQLLRLRLHRVT